MIAGEGQMKVIPPSFLRRRTAKTTWLPVPLGLSLVLLACSLSPAPQSGELRPDPQLPLPGRARIVEPTQGWPRTIRDAKGVVTIPARPIRIHTLSVGYDEITFRLVDPSRIVAVGRSTANPELSNVAAEAQRVPHHVGRNAEEIVALTPDLVVASPFSSRDLLEHLQAADVPLVLADLASSADAHAENIRLLAYIYGEEARGEALIDEVRARMDRIDRIVLAYAPPVRPRVLLLSGTSAAGDGTNEDGLLRRAGAVNAAGAAGISGHRQISLEAIAAIDPDAIVLAQSEIGRPSAVDAILGNAALQDVRAIRTNRVLRVKWSLLTTLSHWNVAGAEELVRGLYPDAAGLLVI